ncbi:MAG: hypothetical protein LBU34_09420 [Planctomycetaceae bacterium]|jgi:hypothetical protein|nr:hypothetical protein [Planctomycetaceae bacterium]
MGVIEFAIGFVFAMRFLVNSCREIQYQPCNFKRRFTMENFVRCMAVFLGKFLCNFFEKIPMLKWISLVNQGGGGRIR